MIFSSYEFLFLFLPVVLAGYYLLFAYRGRVVFLTAMSYLFYGWWDVRFCGLLLASTVIDYLCGRKIVAAPSRSIARRWLTLSMVSNLGMLGFFKYYDLFASTLNYGLATLFSSTINHPPSTLPLLPLLHLVLPVGISFYTFQSMSYSIDLYQGRAKPARDLWHFACYVSLFPQLVAGPIVRYHELADQLDRRDHTVAKASVGAALFTLGFAKKILVADAVAPLVGTAFGGETPGLIGAWVGVLAYTMQIYFDFSGYSDMAIGLGMLFGFRFPINFNSPYKAWSITEFWRRWHISLSNWLRDYLYIPLGGSRLTPGRTYLNLFVVMLLGGLWHGANWTFVVWGGFHGLLLAWERFTGSRGRATRHPLRRARTFLLVMLGWVVFRAESVPEAWGVWTGLAGLNGWGSLAGYEGSVPVSAPLLLLALATILSWVAPNTGELLRPFDPSPVSPFGLTTVRGVGWLAGCILLLIVCILVMLINTSSPFLYFQF